jgi:hypothetical protein
MAAPLKKVVDNNRLVDDDREVQRFRASRTAFVSKDVLALERANILDIRSGSTWAMRVSLPSAVISCRFQII